jgi:hypothetical protein
MTKNDLKTGMLVQTRDGDVGLVLRELNTIIFKEAYLSFSDFEEDLTFELRSCDANIIRVTNVLEEEALTVDMWKESNVKSNLLWEKEFETIKIGENTYNKAEFEEAVKNLKTINK